MEDATKALLIAAGVFFGLMVITLCIFAYMQVTDYYKNQQTEKELQQILEFNSEYDKYIKDDVRGSELLSLINKVVDYNKREADADGIKFERLILSININGKEEEFKYKSGTYDSTIKPDTIIKSCNNTINDADLYKISNAVSNIQIYSGYTESQLQSLATNISNIFAPDEYPSLNTTPTSILQKRNSVVRDITGTEFDDIQNKSDLKKATLEYYQYQKFKRAHFDCEQDKIKYNKNTGRIVKLSFKFNGEFE